MTGLGPVLRWIGRSGKRIVVTLVGCVLLVAGAIMMVTPGPGLVAILAGLALLATEYAWAERALLRARERAKQAASRIRGGSSRAEGAGEGDPERG